MRSWHDVALAVDVRRIALVFLILAAVLYRVSETVADPDLWGHLKFGQDFLASGKIADSDPYSYFTGDKPWINHEWLVEAIIAAIFVSAGAPGLILVKTILALALVVFSYRDLCRAGLSPGPAGVVIVLMTILLIPGITTFRPQLFTYLLFFLLLLWMREVERGRVRFLAAVPLLFVPWANLHGGFLVGLAVLGVWSVAGLLLALARTRSARESYVRGRWLVVAFVASILATLVNPYGYRLLTFLIRPSTFVRPEITEWQPTKLATVYGIAYGLAVLVALVAVVYGRRAPTASTLVGLACLVAPLLAYRHGPLFAVALPVLFGDHIASLWNRIPLAPSKNSGRRLRWLHAAGWSMAGVALVFFSVPHFKCIRHEASVTEYPVRAVAVIKNSGVSGNLAVWFDWGEYALWHLGPQVKVSVDGRRETIYSDSAYAANQAFFHGVGAWDSLLTERETTMVLASKAMPMFNLMKLVRGWTLVYEDSLSGLFAREASPLVEQLRRSTSPPTPVGGQGLCFPA